MKNNYEVKKKKRYNLHNKTKYRKSCPVANYQACKQQYCLGIQYWITINY